MDDAEILMADLLERIVDEQEAALAAELAEAEELAAVAVPEARRPDSWRTPVARPADTAARFVPSAGALTALAAVQRRSDPMAVPARTLHGLLDVRR
jgi:hypothetical protein